MVVQVMVIKGRGKAFHNGLDRSHKTKWCLALKSTINWTSRQLRCQSTVSKPFPAGVVQNNAHTNGLYALHCQLLMTFSTILSHAIHLSLTNVRSTVSLQYNIVNS